LQKLRLEPFDAPELAPVRHLRAGVDDRVVRPNAALVAVPFAVAPLAGGVVIFQRKTEWIDLVVAPRAGGRFAMSGPPLPRGGLVDAGHFRGDLADVRHGQSGIETEERAEQPDAAHDRRSPRAIRGDALDGSLRDQPAACRRRRRRLAAGWSRRLQS